MKKSTTVSLYFDNGNFEQCKLQDYHLIWLFSNKLTGTLKNELKVAYLPGPSQVGGPGGPVPPSFWQISYNTISTRGAHYAHHITTCHPRFSDLATALPTFETWCFIAEIYFSFFFLLRGHILFCLRSARKEMNLPLTGT